MTSESVLRFTDQAFVSRVEEQDRLREMLRGDQSVDRIAILQGESGCGKSCLVEKVLGETGSLLTLRQKFDQQEARQEGDNASGDTLSWAFSMINDLLKEAMQQYDASMVLISKLKTLLHSEHETSSEENRDSAANGALNAVLAAEMPILQELGLVSVARSNTRRQLHDSFNHSYDSSITNRIKFLLVHILQCLCADETPLVMFVDDIQWMSNKDLEFLLFILQEPKLQNLKLIATCRLDPEAEACLVQDLVALLETAQLEFTRITLKNFEKTATAELITASLQTDVDKFEQLVDAIHAKTYGNPFYTTTILRMCVEREILVFSYSTHSWTFDEEQFLGEKIMISNNIVPLLTHKLQTYPSETVQSLLKRIGFLPSPFDVESLEILVRVDGQATNDVQETLRLLVADRILEICGEQSSVYRFTHDRIQQAVSQMWHDDEEQEKATIRYGLALTQSYILQHGKDRVFYAALDRLNCVADSECLSNKKSIDFLIRCNHEGGNRSIASAAFGRALRYFQRAIHLLKAQQKESTGIWAQSSPYKNQLALELHSRAASVAFCVGNFTCGYECAIAVLQQNNHTTDISIRALLSDAYSQEGRYQEAEQMNLEILHLVKEFPKGFKNPIRVIRRYKKVKATLSKMKEADFRAIAPLEDKGNLAATKAFARLIPIYYKSDSKIPMVSCTLRILEISLQHGFAVATNYALSVFASLLFSVLGDPELGKRIMEIAFAMNETTPQNEFSTQVIFVASAYLRPWFMSCTRIMDELNRGYESGMLSGDIEFASMSLMCANIMGFAIGFPLQSLVQDGELCLSTFRQYRADSVFQLYSTVFELMQALAGNKVRDMDAMSWSKSLASSGSKQSLKNVSEKKIRGWEHAMRAQAAYYFHDYASAEIHLQLEADCSKTDSFFFKVVSHCFYTCLVSCAQYRKSHQWKYKGLANKKLQVMKKMMETKGMNNIHKYKLLVAEHAATFSGKKVSEARLKEIRQLFEASIQMSSRAGFIQDCALSNELCGEWYLRHGDRYWSEYYLSRSRDLYREWGALEKVRQIEVNRQSLLAAIPKEKALDMSPARTSGSLLQSRHRNRYRLINTLQSIHNPDDSEGTFSAISESRYFAMKSKEINIVGARSVPSSRAHYGSSNGGTSITEGEQHE